jgi:hypothetical protein
MQKKLVGWGQIYLVNRAKMFIGIYGEGADLWL